MKKTLLFVIVILSYYSYSQCNGIGSGFNVVTEKYNWVYCTDILRNGTPEYPVTPTSFYYRYKFELVRPNGSIQSTRIINPEEYSYSLDGNYIYQAFSIDPNSEFECLTKPWAEDEPGVSMRLTIVQYIPWYFGGFLQGDYLEMVVPNNIYGPSGHLVVDFQCSEGGNGNNSINLEVTELSVTVDGTTYNTSNNFNNNVPILEFGEEHDFNIVIENNGGLNISTSPYDIYVSTGEEAYPEGLDEDVYFFRSGNGGFIDANSETTDSFSEFIYDNISLLDLEPNTDYWMFIHVDPDNNISESNEDDNIAKIKFQYTNATGRISLQLTPTNSIEIPFDYTQNTQNTNLKLYNITGGSTLFTPVINMNFSGSTLNVDISNLPAGRYAVHINDQFERQIGKKRKDRNYIS
ncbi:T9SS type A sorting domain-containing protein [Winogradskyella sp. 3972H.M.0a.05]|uniref:T9SS type A sorting domain-containing protein n=1 Tax=Winogradskyella sp. 3972H.M.0a.05 TaxID=2950277 RepID=UPI003398365C